MSTKIKSQKSKDYTKYSFLGKRYGKGTLVLAVVKKYVEDHPNVTSEKLKEIFPREEVKSSFEVVAPARKAEKRRFFLGSKNLVKTADGNVAVTNQWSKNNIEHFINFAKNLDFKITKKHALSS